MTNFGVDRGQLKIEIVADFAKAHLPVRINILSSKQFILMGLLDLVPEEMGINSLFEKR